MKVSNLEDKRQKWKVKHNLVDVIVIVMLAILTGHNNFEEMVIFAEARIDIILIVFMILIYLQKQ